MSEEQLKELQKYNLEYLEAQSSEEIFSGDYTSAVELKHVKKEIERLNNIIFELREKNRNLLEDNMRLRKELNLHSGKLYISDIEVKNVF